MTQFVDVLAAEGISVNTRASFVPANAYPSLKAGSDAVSLTPTVLKGSTDQLVTSRLDITGEPILDLSNITISQANGVNLPVIARIHLSSASPRNYRGMVSLFVDGNRDNNTDVTAIEVTALKRAMSDVVLSAVKADTGIRITGDSELFSMKAFVDFCGVGMKIDNTGSTTPDEMDIRLIAHECDQFLNSSGTAKMSGAIHIVAEQAHGWGAYITCGWYQLTGEMRAVGTQALGGGGIYVEGPQARLGGDIAIVGGHISNCNWMADLQEGFFNGLKIGARGDFKAGLRVGPKAEGSVQFMVDNGDAPRGGPSIHLQGIDSDRVNSFTVLPGSRAFASTNGDPAVLIEYAQSCVIDLERMSGSKGTGVKDVVIASTGLNNTIYIPNRTAANVAFDIQGTGNVIFLRGAYSLSALNGIEGLVKGFQAEYVNEFNGAGYYNGTSWQPMSSGLLFAGSATVLAAGTGTFEPHGLVPQPSEQSLSIFPGSSLGAATKWWADVTQNGVLITLDQAPGVDVIFHFAIRST